MTNPTDWAAASKDIARTIASHYDTALDLTTEEAEVLRAKLETLFTQYLGQSNFDEIPFYAAKYDPVLSKRLFDAGSMQHITDDDIRAYAEPCVRDCLQRFGEIAALGITGKMSPSSAAKYPPDTHVITIPADEQALAMQAANAAARGEIMLAAFETNAVNTEGHGMLITPKKEDNPYDIPLILFFTREDKTGGQTLTSDASDSMDVITVLHEAAHNVDNTDGTPIRGNDEVLSPLESLLTEYTAYYHEYRTTYGDSLPADELAARFHAACVDYFRNVDTGYEDIIAGLRGDNVMNGKFQAAMHALKTRMLTPAQFHEVMTAPDVETARKLLTL